MILAAALLSIAAPGRAATGLTGNIFNPQKWSLINSNLGNTPLQYQETVPGQTGNYLYICQATTQLTYQVGCINNDRTFEGQNPPPLVPFDQQYTVIDPMQSSGNIFLIGSDNIASFDGGGASGTQSSTDFSVTNTSAYKYFLDFNVAFYGFCNGGSDPSAPPQAVCPDPNAAPTFNILTTSQNISTTAYTYTGGTFSQPLNLALLPGESLTFQILTNNNSPDMTPSLAISGFNYVQEVPAPLPALGAATAFAYSRRMRRRIQLRQQKPANAA